MNGDGLYFGPCLNPGGAWDGDSEPSQGGFLVPPSLRSDILLSALQGSALLLGPDEPAATRKPPTWRQKLRWKLTAWREQAARRAFRVIAGYWPDDGEDW